MAQSANRSEGAYRESGLVQSPDSDLDARLQRREVTLSIFRTLPVRAHWPLCVKAIHALKHSEEWPDHEKILRVVSHPHGGR
jgi:hypothetical protein